MEVITCTQLSSIALLTPLLKLGVHAQIAELFGPDGEGIVTLVGISPELKTEKLCRFLSMIEALGRCVRCLYAL